MNKDKLINGFNDGFSRASGVGDIDINDFKQNTIYSGYIIKFNEPDKNGRIYTKDSINISHLEELKQTNKIVDYYMDNNGLKLYSEKS